MIRHLGKDINSLVIDDQSELHVAQIRNALSQTSEGQKIIQHRVLQEYAQETSDSPRTLPYPFDNAIRQQRDTAELGTEDNPQQIQRQTRRLESHKLSQIHIAVIRKHNMERAAEISNRLSEFLPRLGFLQCLCRLSMEETVQAIAQESIHCEMGFESLFFALVRSVYQSHFEENLNISIPSRTELWRRQGVDAEQGQDYSWSQRDFEWPVFDMAQFEFGNARPGTCFDNVLILINLPRATKESAGELLTLLSDHLFTIISDPIQVALPSVNGTGRTKGYAFLEFDNSEVTRLAVLAVDGLQWGENPQNCIRSELFRKYQSDTSMTARLDMHAHLHCANEFQLSQNDRSEPDNNAFDGENQQDLSEDLGLAEGSTSSGTMESEGEITSFVRDLKMDKDELYHQDLASDQDTSAYHSRKHDESAHQLESNGSMLSTIDLSSAMDNTVGHLISPYRTEGSNEEYDFLGRQMMDALRDSPSSFSSSVLSRSRLRRRKHGTSSYTKKTKSTRAIDSQDSQDLGPSRALYNSDILINMTAHGSSSLESSRASEHKAEAPTSTGITEPWKDYCEELVCRNRELQEQVVASRQCMIRQGQNNQKLHVIVDRLERDRDGLLFENDLLQAQINAYEEHEQHYDAIVRELNALQNRLKRQQTVWELYPESPDRTGFMRQHPCWMHDASERRRDRFSSLKSMQGVTLASFESMTCEKIIAWEHALENALSKARIVREAKTQRLQEQLDQQAEIQQEQKTCVICLTHEKSILCLPCRHLCMCSECSSRGDVVKCPICRLDIAEKLKIYS